LPAPGDQLVQLAGPGRIDQRVDERRQLVPRGHGDGRLALLELDRLGAVIDAHHELPGGVGAPPGSHGLLLLDLAPLVALARPPLGDAHVRGVLEQEPLLLEAADELGPAVGDRVVAAGRQVREGEDFRIGMELPPS
jgi:hypothetical protein